MRPISARISIDAPREHVFGLLDDLALRPAFTDHFLDDFRLERIESQGPGAAARFRLSDSKVRMNTVIEHSERPHLVRERGRGGRSNRTPALTVWELAVGPGPGTCEATVTFWTEPGGPIERARELLVSKRALRRGWRRAMLRLRDLAESGERPRAVTVAGGDRPPALVS